MHMYVHAHCTGTFSPMYVKAQVRSGIGNYMHMYFNADVHSFTVRSCTGTFRHLGVFMKRYAHVDLCSCSCLFMHRHAHAQVCPCTCTFMHSNVQVQVHSCIGTFMHILLYEHTFLYIFIDVCFCSFHCLHFPFFASPFFCFGHLSLFAVCFRRDFSFFGFIPKIDKNKFSSIKSNTDFRFLSFLLL